jgi:hypothetical protein
MDPYQLIKEAEIMKKVRKTFEASPSEKIPSLRQVRRDAGLQRAGPGLETYLDNLRELQDTMTKLTSDNVQEEMKSLLKLDKIEATPFGYIAQCDEEDPYDADGLQKFSDFQTFHSCVIVVSPQMQGRLVVYWEYMDCGRPDGCQRVVNPVFAKEILHGRNYFFSDQAYRLLKEGGEGVTQDEEYDLALNSMQQTVLANLTAEGITQRNLIYDIYMPLSRLVKDYKQKYPELDNELMNADYTVESVTVELYAALARLSVDLILPIVGNVPFDVLSETLPDIVAEYANMTSDEFQRRLLKARKSMRKIDEIFDNETLFASLIKKLLS